MAPPLTRKTAKGVLYVRPADVEAEIDEARSLTFEDLKKRLQVRNPRKNGFMRSETLVHLVRTGISSKSMDIVNAVVPVLLSRCEATLERKLPDHQFPTAEGLREEILGEFGELLAADGRGEFPDELDYYECRFNSAFMTLRVDRVNPEIERLKRFMPVDSIEDFDESRGEDSVLEDVAEWMRGRETPESALRMQRLLEAIQKLPKDERDAVVLVHILGLKEESQDPSEETAATRSKCTGRAIRYRLDRAAAKLAHFQEDK